MLPIAVDAMGGDNAPAAIVAGARRAASEMGIPVLLVGRPEDLVDTGDLEVIEASEVIAMDAEPGSSVRRMRDSSLVRAATAVRDGRASAMVSAGNTGATMASALLRMGRIRGINRPAIAIPVPVPQSTPTTLLDAGANAECRPEWLVEFAQMGCVYARDRFRIERPKVGLLSIGEEAGKGNKFVKECFELLDENTWAKSSGAEWIGNVEGRDVMTDEVDVVVTDGFTGNVTLKTLEGAMSALLSRLLTAIDTDDETRRAGEMLSAPLDSMLAELHPDSTGGALLLGVKGVCVISHGSSSADAMANAIRIAAEMVDVGMVDHLSAAVRQDR
ncbi:MAG: phosphate acyltransferase PlsX [Acidimicrobiaceae bacterium]|nr:phosphate acyltransferase PlsX [Acidimicrobiaceae bacterium]MXW62412.1 phosphate acyltransferase PlsX [Acidimicrobiaceae bacterium]MYC41452.1 phosphate acyltransferase PlsX [Acidimicrobiaceae bacterium]